MSGRGFNLTCLYLPLNATRRRNNVKFSYFFMTELVFVAECHACPSRALIEVPSRRDAAGVSRLQFNGEKGKVNFARNLLR